MIDVLIIGSGAAGLTAALEAKKYTNNIVVLSKTYPTHSQTAQAQGGINAALAQEDSVEQHIKDTLKSAHGLGDEKAIEILCTNAKDSIQWLDEIGVPFSRTLNSSIAQRQLGGTKKTRACYSSDYTGLKILHTLYDQCIKEGIVFYNERMMLDVIVENETAQGIIALDISSTKVEEYRAKKVILATGGYSGLYFDYTTNSYSTTGDGVAVAYRAGCTLKDMEYIQFHPTTLEKNNILISESARGEGGYLVDKDGQRFVDELLPRDEVARAILSKIDKGEEVFLDLRHLGKEKINEAMPQENRLVHEFCHLKMEDDLIPIHPAAHYTMGGIKTNHHAQTNIQNLYACGECANSGVHGANRLGGNSLLELIVFGKIAGKHASMESLEYSAINIDQHNQHLDQSKEYVESLFHSTNEINFYEKRETMGKEFFKKIGLFRTQNEMQEVLSLVQQWKKKLSKMGIGDKSKTYNRNLIEFIEFSNMLELSEIIVSSALNRCESRGAHYRLDYPLELEEFAYDFEL
ncbi:MAG: FAD-dependent oxidoreductase, partial [Campylobacterota bacterium]|nr:FAD-dependent oxidoreductase [Campylobacterota bacterium]